MWLAQHLSKSEKDQAGSIGRRTWGPLEKENVGVTLVLRYVGEEKKRDFQGGGGEKRQVKALKAGRYFIDVGRGSGQL